MRRSTTAPALLVTVMSLAGLVAGCGLPTSGKVRIDQQVPDQTVDGPEIRKLPPGPGPGQTPEQVANGFLEAAAASPESQHALAREFLATGAQWDDTGTVTVYDATTLQLRRAPGGAAEKPGTTGPAGTTSPPNTTGPPGTTSSASGPSRPAAGAAVTLTLTADAVALLEPDGTIRPSGRPLRLVLRLVRQQGDWRIAGVPRGVVLTPRDLSRGYSAAVLWLATPHGLLAPQPVALTGDRAALPGAVVRALLARMVLPPGAASGPPLGLVGSVVLDGSTAVVDLSRGAYGLDDEARRLLLAQVAAALGSLPSVDSVRVLSDGRPLPGGELAARVPPDLAPRSAGAGVAAGASSLVTLDDTAGRSSSGLVTVGGPPPGVAVPAVRLPEAGAASVALAADTRRVAVVTGTGASLLTGTLGGTGTWRAPVGGWRFDNRGSFTGVTFLADGTLLASRASAPSVVALSPEGSPRPAVEGAPAGLPAAAGVTALAADPSGTRLAAAVGPPGHAQLWLADVNTGRQGAVISNWEPASAQLTAVSALAWSDPLTLVVAGRLRGGRAALVELRLTTPTSLATLSATGLPGAALDAVTACAAAPGRPLLVVAAGRLWQQSGSRWRGIGQGTAASWPG